MKTFTEIVMLLICLVFWSVVLPAAALVEAGVLVVDHIDGHAPHGMMTKTAS